MEVMSGGIVDTLPLRSKSSLSSTALADPLVATPHEPHHHHSEPETLFTRVIRWWILALFFLLGFSQNMCWNLFSPISDTSKMVYGWSDSGIAWIENASNITILIGIPPASMLLDTRGLRPAVLICGFLLTLSAAMRCFNTKGWSPAETEVLMFASMGINGFGATALNFAAPNLSSSWFPPEYRATATAIASVSPYIGAAVGFLVGPAFVRDVPKDASHETIEAARKDFMNLYIAQTVFTGTLFLLSVFYFPSRPPLAPSSSEAAERDQMKTRSPMEGFREMFVKLPKEAVRVWLVIFAFAMPLGVFNGWVAIMDINLEQAGLTRKEASWLGFVMTLAGCAGGILVGLIVDRLDKKLKALIYLLYGIAAVFFGWFALQLLELVPHPEAAIYFAGIGAGFALNCTIPIFFELCSECAYPVVPSGTASGLLVGILNLVEILFLGVSFGPSAKHTKWMNVLQFGIIPLACLLLLPCKVEYKRTQMDQLDQD